MEGDSGKRAESPRPRPHRPFPSSEGTHLPPVGVRQLPSCRPKAKNISQQKEELRLPRRINLLEGGTVGQTHKIGGGRKPKHRMRAVSSVTLDTGTSRLKRNVGSRKRLKNLTPVPHSPDEGLAQGITKTQGLFWSLVWRLTSSHQGLAGVGGKALCPRSPAHTG